MSEEEADVRVWRERVARAHDWVPVGRYVDAAKVFAAALPALRELLGADHPEVAELRDDLAALEQMAGLAAHQADLGATPDDPVARALAEARRHGGEG